MTLPPRKRSSMGDLALRRLVILALCPVGAFAAPALEHAAHFNAAGYRDSHYRAPTPASVPHGETLDTVALRRLIDRGQLALIDVQAVPVRAETAQFGISWLPSRTRYHIPGSTWLPNVGYGALNQQMDRYFRAQLARLTGSDVACAIVFYCIVDCWMSWNAVVRAASYGYENLFWYPEGADGWAARGLPLVRGEPVPLDFAVDEPQADGDESLTAPRRGATTR